MRVPGELPADERPAEGLGLKIEIEDELTSGAEGESDVVATVFGRGNAKPGVGARLR